MAVFSRREIVFLDVFQASDYLVFAPERIVLRAGARTFDIGAYCYSLREAKAGTRSLVKLVDLSSYCQFRSALVGVLVKYCINIVTLSGMPNSTMSTKWSMLKNFLEWCDESGNFVGMSISVVRRTVVKKYCEHLAYCARLDDRATNKYANLQNQIIEILTQAYNDDFVGHGILRLRLNNSLCVPTAPPPDEDQVKSLDMCYAVYKGFSAFFMGFQKYPFKWDLPKYIGQAVWVFPCIIKFISPLDSQRCSGLNRAAGVIDFNNGCVLSLELAEKVFNNRDTARSCRNLMLQTIAHANSDPRNFRRVELARYAMFAFFFIFQAKATVSLTQAIDLKWSGEYSISKADPKFRVIKFRAGAKVQNFRVSSDFVPEFEEFLKFRARLLGECKCDYLFFSFDSKKGPFPLPEGIVQQFNRTLNRVDPCFRLLRTREWRAAKSDFLLSSNSPIIASDSLQNTPETIVDHYAEGRDTDQKIQFKAFYERLSEVVVKTTISLLQISVACCDSYGSPLAERGAPIEPDCTKEFGCLFCAFLKVHASEGGVRKLLSCRYFIYRISYINSSTKSQDDLYAPIIQRINEIVEYIRVASEEFGAMVERVERSVDVDEELDPYWESRIQVLVEIGVL
ncbi:MAG: hypothetical protein Q7T74_01655 [Candidatus Saccharibacteria bacterium]|nr:hypothetical protein [Candidatus Saccharibacteria bacterium]